ncbi:nucleotidyltransferase family protein [Thalassovita taeanensis]|uniref:CTP:molybdopterin cytidylyltransferase MocA n=1 Tax=Thalassovita taeanensis TaxID=657014 RepID=A0A1H8YX39_9RHOB|nr:nucleotidyltransferase family protein [Thalassovita taeanensis]SEP56692.1 CTP:molybdopterin cytidylyltransferase MocA [Thalassovita taeanensis]
MPETTAILLLAAGSSSRMGPGRDKLLELLDGTPLLSRMIARASATGLPVWVTLPGPDHARAAVLTGTGATPVWVRNAALGMSASIRAGVAALPDHIEAVMILPADMPDLSRDDLRQVADCRRDFPPDALIRGSSSEGHPGHPVLFPRCYFNDLLQLGGDEGARALLRQHRDRVHLCPLPDQHALTDLDTPEAWEVWRARQS